MNANVRVLYEIDKPGRPHRFDDLFECDMGSCMLNRRSRHREIRLYLLSLYAYRKGNERRKAAYYKAYLREYHSGVRVPRLGGR